MDWWLNFNHMEGLTDRCYRVTISSESKSGDSLGENQVFLNETRYENGSQSQKTQNLFYVLFSLFGVSLFHLIMFGYFSFFQSYLSKLSNLFYLTFYFFLITLCLTQHCHMMMTKTVLRNQERLLSFRREGGFNMGQFCYSMRIKYHLYLVFR